MAAELLAPPPAPTPDRIVRMVMDYRASKVLLAASFHNIFTHIAEGRVTLPAICGAAGLNPRATEIVLDALVSLGFLTRERGRYANTPESDAFLVKGRPGYMGNNLAFQEYVWDAWSQLRRILKTGRPARALQNWLFEDPKFGTEYIRGMQNIARGPAAEIAALFPPGPATALLDVGAGPGEYSLAFLRRQPHLRATLLDLPPTVAIARRILAGEPLRDRVDFVLGNYHTRPFGQGKYDFVILSHITHDEGGPQNRKLIAKAFDALRPGGRIIVHDFMTRRGRPAPAFEALFSVHMLVYTESGRVYSVEEYSSWLWAAGFRSVRAHQIGRQSLNSTIALVADRPSR